MKKKKLLNNGEAPIFARITYNGSTSEFSTKRSIKPVLWMQSAGKSIGKDQGNKNLNQYLDVLRAKVWNAFHSLLEFENVITAKEIKNKALGLDEVQSGIIQIYEEHNEEMKKGIGITVSHNTLKRHKTACSHVARFITLKYGRKDLSLHEVNPQFIKSLEQYFRIDRSCNHNSTMKYLKNFKKITSLAKLNGWMKNDPFVGFKFTYQKTIKPFL